MVRLLFSRSDPTRDPIAMFIPLHSDRMNVNTRRRRILVIERRLRFEQIARIFKDNSRVGVARLVNIDCADSGPCRILFQIVGKGARGERPTRTSGAIVPGPERIAGV